MFSYGLFTLLLGPNASLFDQELWHSLLDFFMGFSNLFLGMKTVTPFAIMVRVVLLFSQGVLVVTAVTTQIPKTLRQRKLGVRKEFLESLPNFFYTEDLHRRILHRR